MAFTFAWLVRVACRCAPAASRHAEVRARASLEGCGGGRCPSRPALCAGTSGLRKSSHFRDGLESMPLEVLHRPLVLLRRRARGESAEIAPPAGLRILLARVEPVFAGRELADHGVIVAQRYRLNKRRRD